MVIRELARYKSAGCLALVGHEPDLSELAGRLLKSTVALRFKKGGVCRIDIEALPPKNPGTLSWLLAPNVLVTLHRDTAAKRPKTSR